MARKIALSLIKKTLDFEKNEATKTILPTFRTLSLKIKELYF
jgi:hypothetical protein